MTQNLFWQATKFVIRDGIGEILTFPFWWYTGGLLKVWQSCQRNSLEANETLGFTIWLTNLFRPMFAQYDWQGRLISFFVRIFQIVIRGLALAVWLVLIWLWLLIWIFLPFLLIYGVAYNFGWEHRLLTAVEDLLSII